MERSVDDVPEHGTVVRGGVKRLVSELAADLEDAVDQGYGPVLSVYMDVATGTESVSQTLLRICDEANIPNGQVQTSTVGELLLAGFEIEPYLKGDWSESHCHVTFGYPLEPAQLEAFVKCFDGPVKNPTGGRKAKR